MNAQTKLQFLNHILDYFLQSFGDCNYITIDCSNVIYDSDCTAKCEQAIKDIKFVMFVNLLMKEQTKTNLISLLEMKNLKSMADFCQLLGKNMTAQKHEELFPLFDDSDLLKMLYIYTLIINHEQINEDTDLYSLYLMFDYTYEQKENNELDFINNVTKFVNGIQSATGVSEDLKAEFKEDIKKSLSSGNNNIGQVIQLETGVDDLSIDVQHKIIDKVVDFIYQLPKQADFIEKFKEFKSNTHFLKENVALII